MDLAHPEHATVSQLAIFNNLTCLAERLDEVKRVVETYRQTQPKVRLVRLIVSVPRYLAHTEFSGLKHTHARQNTGPA